jgi:hypothetical protein
MNLNKTAMDKSIEKRDLEKDKTMIFLANMDSAKFKVGDILIKKCLIRGYDDDESKWIVEIDENDLPVMYVYAFENKLGVGYVKQLNPDGTGPSRSKPIPMTKIDLSENKFELDPGYAEHLLLGEGEYKYNERHERILRFREEALNKNKALCIPSDIKNYRAWWKTLKVEDTLYVGDMSSDLGRDVFKVIKVGKNSTKITFEAIKGYYYDFGDIFTMGVTLFREEFGHVSMTKPFPLTEDGQ